MESGRLEMTETNANTSPKIQVGKLSPWIAACLTVLALLCGLLLKISIQKATTRVENSGVTAEFPRDWKVESGVAGEQFVFGGSDPFDTTLKYTVSTMPASNQMKITDLVITRNMQRGQKMNLYKVLEQGPVIVNGKDFYRVHFVYVDPGVIDTLPRVVEGLDYYFYSKPKSIISTLETETNLFLDAQPRFKEFLGTVSFAAGGTQ
jgi:hypothetical protein